ADLIRVRRTGRSGHAPTYGHGVTFAVSAEDYNRFMGRYSEPLAEKFSDFAGIGAGQHVLDVGCGPGALTVRLVQLVGPGRVSAIDPSASFVDAVRARFPEVDVHTATAEDLPFPRHTFDAALAQLVVHFMSDPLAGLSEMGRVTRPGGVVAACVWDHAGGGGPLSTFWTAVHELDPTAPGEAGLAGAREGQLAELAEAAKLRSIVSGSLSIRLGFDSFAEWWEPFTLGVGPAGDYVASLPEEGRGALRARCSTLLGPPPFEVVAEAWSVRGYA
ncbi:MAG TPA: class I SAM-dependent methyltransferase, partial [Propionibacteriaceae bacterium]|nr:class I SAM-dependent methyltransferase [Propionibacteriaceae bacterium]